LIIHETDFGFIIDNDLNSNATNVTFLSAKESRREEAVTVSCLIYNLLVAWDHYGGLSDLLHCN
jgi:hypothetical protein